MLSLILCFGLPVFHVPILSSMPISNTAVDVCVKGLSLDRGGAVGLWRGSMASLIRPRFTENYAALSRASSPGGVPGNSHDVAVAVSF